MHHLTHLITHLLIHPLTHLIIHPITHPFRLHCPRKISRLPTKRWHVRGQRSRRMHLYESILAFWWMQKIRIRSVCRARRIERIVYDSIGVWRFGTVYSQCHSSSHAGTYIHITYIASIIHTLNHRPLTYTFSIIHILLHTIANTPFWLQSTQPSPYHALFWP